MRYWIVVAGLGLHFAAAAAKPIIALQPLGEIAAKDIEAARAGILAVYDVEVRVVPTLKLPAAAYYPPRSRYRAEKLLDFLA
ncbi:MAG: hypothetical protein RLZZ522_492, partial [Verrucomicrobiota bacterium]